MARKTFVEEMEDKYNLAPTTGAEEVQTDTTTSDSTGRRGFEDQFKGYDLGAVEQKYGLTPIAVPENSLAAQSQQAYSDWKIKAQQGHDEWMKRLERGDFINKDNRKQSETASPEAKTQQEEDPSFKRQAREWIADTVDKAFGEGASDGRWYGADSNPILGFITDRWARQKEPDYEPDAIDKAGDWFYGDNSIPGIIADTVVGKDRAPEPRRAPEVKQAPSYGTDDYLSEQQALLNANKPKETAPVAEPETPAPAPTEAPSLDELRSEWYELRAKETMGQASDEEIARARELEQEIQNHDDLTDWFSKPPINDWEGRQELIDELNNLPFTAEGKARQAEIVAALREGDEKAGNPAMPYTGMERLESAVNAAGHGIEASAVNTAGTAAALANQNSSEYESTNPNNSRVTGVNAATGRTYSENDAVAAALDEQAALRAAEESRRRREAGERYNAEHTGLAETSDKLWETADALDEKSQKELAEAKAGLSKLGQAGVDLGENLLEMGFDAVVGSATGVGGLTSMGARLFGSATQEARQEGVDLTSQLTYGALETAKEIFTEKMFDGLAGIYGAGAADEIIEKFVGRMADTDLGRTLLRGVIGSGGEGLEEVASAYLDPLAKQFISNDSVGELYRQIDGDEVMYEFFMGAAAGLFGNAGTIVTGQDAAKNAELRAEENAPQYNPIEETVSAAPQFTQATAPEATTQSETTPFEVAPALNTTPTETRADDTTAVESAPESVTVDQTSEAEPIQPETGTIEAPTRRLPGEVPNSKSSMSPQDLAAVSELARESGGLTMEQANDLGMDMTEEQLAAYNDRIASDPEQAGKPATTDEELAIRVRDVARSLGVADKINAEEVGHIVDAVHKLLAGKGFRYFRTMHGSKIADIVAQHERELMTAQPSETNYPTAGTVPTFGEEVTTEAQDTQATAGTTAFPETTAAPNPIADTVEESTRTLPGTETNPAEVTTETTAEAETPAATVDQTVQSAILGEESTSTEAQATTEETKAVEPVTADEAAQTVAKETGVKDTAKSKPKIIELANSITENGITPEVWQQATEAAEQLLASSSISTDPETVDNTAKSLLFAAGHTAGVEYTALKSTPRKTGMQMPKRSQTESNTGQAVAKKTGAKQEVSYYMPVTERQSITAAINRVDADLTGEVQKLINKDMWTGEDMDTAWTILGRLQADSVANGDVSTAPVWFELIKSHATETARALQSIAKWSRSGSAQAASAAEQIAKNKTLPKDELNRIVKALNGYGQEYDSIADSTKSESENLKDIRELILRLNKFRGTGTFINDNFRKLLDNETDIDYLMEFAQRQMLAIADDYNGETTIGERLKTWQVLAQLSRIGTFARNLGGNITFGTLDTLTQDALGYALDSLVGKATGQREVGFDKGWFSSAARKGAADAFRRSILEVSGDVDMAGDLSKYGTPSNRTHKMTGARPKWRNGFERFMSRWEQLLSYSLTTSDAVFRGKLEAGAREALLNAGYRMTDAKRQELLDKGWSEERIAAQEQADLDQIAKEMADYRLFQNRGVAYNASKGVHDLMNRIAGIGGEVNGALRNGGFGLGDFINPYPGVPANLGVKALEYSPLNIFKGGGELLKLFWDVHHGGAKVGQQSKAIMDIARGMAGTPIIALLAAMFRSGIIKNADDEKDLDAAAQMKAEGRTGVQINLSAFDRGLAGGDTAWKDGDKLLSVGWIEPLNAFMAIASAVANDTDEDPGKLAMVRHSLSGALQGVLDLPVMQNISNIADTFKYSTAEDAGAKVGEAAVQAAGDMLTGMIPAPISQLAKTSDQYFRDTSGDNVFESVWNSALNSIPGARQTLPIKQDNFGNPKESTDDFMDRFLNNFIRPGAVYEMHQSAVSAETEKVYREAEDAGVYPDRNGPKKVSIGGEKYTLTQDERQKYHETAGREIERLYSDLINSDIYDTMTAEEKAETMRDLKGLANDNAKREYAKDHGLEYSSNYDKTAELYDPGAYFAVRNQATTALENGNYDVIDALLGKDGYYSDLSRKAKDRMDTGDTANLDKMYEARQAGISSEQWQQAYDYKKSLEEKPGVTQTQRDNYFKKWLGDNFTSKQADVLHEQMQFRTSSVASSTVYDGLSDKLGSETAVRMYDDMKPYSGQDAKQWEKIQGMAYLSGYTEAEKWAGLSEYVSDSCYKKAMEAKAAGQSFKEWADEYVRKNRK